MPALNVWMNGEHVATWSTTRNGATTLTYAATWLGSEYGRALSLSLPLVAAPLQGPRVTSFFENLLPDSAAIRERMAVRFGARSTGAFDLLHAVGRECVGAVQLLPQDEEPTGFDRVEAEPLTERQVERRLETTTSREPLGAGEEEDLRLSIAGAQEKTALLRIGSRWHRPLGATPTTHIIKLPLGLVGNMQADMRDSIENEWLCGQLLRELGLDVAESEMAQFGRFKVLAVRRFDRRWMNVDPAAALRARFRPPQDAWIARLPQEDLCQATATPPAQKYEADGGPGMRTCLEVLGASSRADQDRLAFVLLQLGFWLLAATDGHAKNFSIAHEAGGTYHLTPAYDVISAWPIIGNGANQLALQRAKLAMAVRATNAHWRLREILPRHWRALADRCGVAGTWDRMGELVANVDQAIERLEARLPAGFPNRVWSAISRGVRSQAQVFGRQ